MTPDLVAVTEVGDGVTLVRLQNPPVNAWTDPLMDAMEAVLKGLERSAGRAVVLTGSGAHFSAGGDFDRFQEITNADDARAFVTRVQIIMDRVAAIPAPVIAAVNGTALGGGLELALACDVRVAGSRARLGLPETKWGILAGAGGTQRLARLVGPGAAKMLMFTARPVDAREALRLGLVDAVSDQEDPLADALELAAVIGANSPRAVRSVKRCVNEGLDLDLPAGLELERELWIDLVAQGDLTEGAAAFFEKRPPRYRD